MALYTYDLLEADQTTLKNHCTGYTKVQSGSKIKISNFFGCDV